MLNNAPITTPTQIVTLRHIAEHCGVAVSTAQRALTGKVGEVSEVTRLRVQAAARELGYNPNHHYAARRLFASRQATPLLSQTIALAFPDVFFTMNYFLEMFRGVLAELNTQSYTLVACTYSGSQFNVPNVIQRGDVDGVLFFGNPLQATTILNALRAEVNFGERPVVSLLFPALPGCSAVLTDDWGGAYAAMAHLLELGHRAVAHFMADATSYHSQQRLGAYRQACLDRGIDPATTLSAITRGPSEPGNEHITRPLLATLKAHPEITAALMPNDPSANAAWEVLEAAGYHIPRNFSLVGYDDTDPMVGGKQRANLLTTVHLPLKEVGHEAASLLIDRSTGRIAGEKTSLLPTSLVIRQSTAAPRKKP